MRPLLSYSCWCPGVQPGKVSLVDKVLLAFVNNVQIVVKTPKDTTGTEYYVQAAVLNVNKGVRGPSAICRRAQAPRGGQHHAS